MTWLGRYPTSIISAFRTFPVDLRCFLKSNLERFDFGTTLSCDLNLELGLIFFYRAALDLPLTNVERESSPPRDRLYFYRKNFQTERQMKIEITIEGRQARWTQILPSFTPQEAWRWDSNRCDQHRVRHLATDGVDGEAPFFGAPAWGSSDGTAKGETEQKKEKRNGKFLFYHFLSTNGTSLSVGTRRGRWAVVERRDAGAIRESTPPNHHRPPPLQKKTSFR